MQRAGSGVHSQGIEAVGLILKEWLQFPAHERVRTGSEPRVDKYVLKKWLQFPWLCSARVVVSQWQKKLGANWRGLCRQVATPKK